MRGLSENEFLASTGAQGMKMSSCTRYLSKDDSNRKGTLKKESY